MQAFQSVARNSDGRAIWIRHVIGEKLQEPRATVLKCLREELELRKIKFRWVPHKLSEKTQPLESQWQRLFCSSWNEENNNGST
jgi:hypothetical protein